MDQNQHPHRRYSALTGDWILVSPHRTKRPWQGRQEGSTGDTRPAHDPKCYLCSGTERAGGVKNPVYSSTCVFTNDFAAIVPNEESSVAGSALLHSQAVSGTCRVICFSPRHDWTLPEMPQGAIRGVVDVWAEQTEELGQNYRWVQVFEAASHGMRRKWQSSVSKLRTAGSASIAESWTRLFLPSEKRGIPY
jgi:UDPglucose--hexose-1-phosphate uridylyltransferase